MKNYLKLLYGRDLRNTMNIRKHLCLFSLALLVVTSCFSGVAFAEGGNNRIENEGTFALADISESEVHVYDGPSTDDEIIFDLKKDQEFTVIKEDGLDTSFTKIKFLDPSSSIDIEGYIQSKFVIQDKDSIERDSDEVEDETESSKNETSGNDELDVKGEEADSIKDQTESEEITEDQTEDPSKVIDEQNETTDKITSDEESVEKENENIAEIAPKNEETVDKSESSNLQMRATSLSIATVSNQEDRRGIALLDKTPVYNGTSTNTSVIKTFSKGTVLEYKTYISGWYEISLVINGKSQKGYIQAKHLLNASTKPKTLKGISLSNLNIYTNATKSSSVLKKYNPGVILTINTFVSGWYETVVTVNGSAKKGYLESNQLEMILADRESNKGVTVQTTNVYAKPSTSATVLNSWTKGTVMDYTPISKNWSKVTITKSGKKVTGYIQSNLVQLADTSTKSIKGISLTNANVYTNASSSSKVLKKYNPGVILTLQPFVSGWYKTKVTINGVVKTGYMDSRQIETILDKRDSQQGLALQSPTNVYVNAATTSKVVGTIPKGTVLDYSSLSKNWYKYDGKISGKNVSGYIFTKDVKTLGTDVIQGSTNYNMTIDQMLDLQMKNNPQTDKYRNEPAYIYADYVDMNKGIVTENRVNVRSSPTTSSSSNIVQMLNKGDGVLVIGKQGSWVEVRITWKNAKASDVMQYMNPENVTFGSREYYQFLKLSLPANLSVAEINQKILKGKGILEGKGQAFVDAANKYKVNEVYLISHSLLETGNGTSKLATGYKVNGKTVYNMYGYGAFDSCPLECGSQAAYDNNWFTPEAAIIGGAELISQRYIYRDGFKQDTLYKMRWNPEGTHQYATDVGWAAKQVSSIYNIYDLLDNYTLYFDKPFYTLSK